MGNHAVAIHDLVGDWLHPSDVASQLGVPVSKVRQLGREHQLVQDDTGRVPALCFDDSGIVKGLPGTLTLLADAGYDNAETIRWLFTPDDSLPGRPIDALREARGTEVRRRAQALGF